LDFV